MVYRANINPMGVSVFEANVVDSFSKSHLTKPCWNEWLNENLNLWLNFSEKGNKKEQSRQCNFCLLLTIFKIKALFR
jgi:hypothetical protein